VRKELETVWKGKDEESQQAKIITTILRLETRRN
jgi:hypothetical protein